MVLCNGLGSVELEIHYRKKYAGEEMCGGQLFEPTMNELYLKYLLRSCLLGTADM